MARSSTTKTGHRRISDLPATKPDPDQVVWLAGWVLSQAFTYVTLADRKPSKRPTEAQRWIAAVLAEMVTLASEAHAGLPIGRAAIGHDKTTGSSKDILVSREDLRRLAIREQLGEVFAAEREWKKSHHRAMARRDQEQYRCATFEAAGIVLSPEQRQTITDFAPVAASGKGGAAAKLVERVLGRSQRAQDAARKVLSADLDPAARMMSPLAEKTAAVLGPQATPLGLLKFVLERVLGCFRERLNTLRRPLGD